MKKRFSGEQALVVGGAGFVGSAVVRGLLAEGIQRITVIDNLLSSERDNLPEDSRIDFVEGSAADGAVLAKLDDVYSYVFHLATFHGNESSVHRPLLDHENTLFVTLRLYERLRSMKKIKRVVYTSTGCALAAKGIDEEAVVEDGRIPLDFDTPYQISKVVGEMYSLYFFRSFGLPVVRARFQNVYGPGEVLGAGQWRGSPATIWRNVVPIFIYRAIKQQPLALYGDGKSARDFIYIDDVVEGLFCMATKPKIEGDVFNIASGSRVMIKELAESVNRMISNKAGIEYIEQRTWDRSIQRFGSTTKAENQIGFKVSVPFELGLEKTIQWTQQNLKKIERCIARHKEFYDPGF